MGNPELSNDHRDTWKKAVSTEETKKNPHDCPHFQRDEAITVGGDVEKRLLDILEGQNVLVGLGNVSDDPPSWYDPVKFRRGQDFFRRNFAGIFMAHLVSLITMLSSPQILKPLIFTQKSETTWKSFRRYVATVVHTSCWYNGNVWRKGDAARRSVQTVRNLHSSAARTTNSPQNWHRVNSIGIGQCGELYEDRSLIAAIAEDTRDVAQCPFASMRRGNAMNSTDPYLFLNQFDMADTQFAFVGVVVLFPHKFGAFRATDDDLMGFIHYWKCIGHLLGIEDRFNFCRDDHDLDFTRRLCAFYLDKMVKPAFKKLSCEYEHMARAVAKGANLYHPGLTFESLLSYYASAVDLKMNNVYQQMSYPQWFHYLYLKFIFGFLCWFPGCMWCFSVLLRFSISLVVDRPGWWPQSWSPPRIDGLSQLWNPSC